MRFLSVESFVCIFLLQTSSSFGFLGQQPTNPLSHNRFLGCISIHHRRTQTGLNAVTEEYEKTGYFRLPKIDSSTRYPSPFDSGSYDDTDDMMPDVVPIDSETKRRLLRQLMFAFDNYREPEIIDMSKRLFKMPSQLKKLLQLTTIAEEIEAAAEAGGGFDEYLYDALRSTRSEIRMYGKDAEFFDEEGRDIRGTDQEYSFWPWER